MLNCNNNSFQKCMMNDAVWGQYWRTEKQFAHLTGALKVFYIMGFVVRVLVRWGRVSPGPGKNNPPVLAHNCQPRPRLSGALGGESNWGQPGVLWHRQGPFQNYRDLITAEQSVVITATAESRDTDLVMITLATLRLLFTITRDCLTQDQIVICG